MCDCKNVFSCKKIKIFFTNFFNKYIHSPFLVKIFHTRPLLSDILLTLVLSSSASAFWYFYSHYDATETITIFGITVSYSKANFEWYYTAIISINIGVTIALVLQTGKREGYLLQQITFANSAFYMFCGLIMMILSLLFRHCNCSLITALMLWLQLALMWLSFVAFWVLHTYGDLELFIKHFHIFERLVEPSLQAINGKKEDKTGQVNALYAKQINDFIQEQIVPLIHNSKNNFITIAAIIKLTDWHIEQLNKLNNSQFIADILIPLWKGKLPIRYYEIWEKYSKTKGFGYSFRSIFGGSDWEKNIFIVSMIEEILYFKDGMEHLVKILKELPAERFKGDMEIMNYSLAWFGNQMEYCELPLSHYCMNRNEIEHSEVKIEYLTDEKLVIFFAIAFYKLKDHRSRIGLFNFDNPKKIVTLIAIAFLYHKKHFSYIRLTELIAEYLYELNERIEIDSLSNEVNFLHIPNKILEAIKIGIEKCNEQFKKEKEFFFGIFNSPESNISLAAYVRRQTKSHLERKYPDSIIDNRIPNLIIKILTTIKNTKNVDR